MNYKIIEINNDKIAVASDDVQIKSPGEMLDLAGTIDYQDGCNKLIMKKEMFPQEFYWLSTGFAGEVLQKMVNYGKKVAVVGDFSEYSTPSFDAFLIECNRGKSFFFVESMDIAKEKLAN